MDPEYFDQVTTGWYDMIQNGLAELRHFCLPNLRMSLSENEQHSFNIHWLWTGGDIDTKGNTHIYTNTTHYNEFSHSKWWFSIVISVIRGYTDDTSFGFALPPVFYSKTFKDPRLSPATSSLPRSSFPNMRVFIRYSVHRWSCSLIKVSMVYKYMYIYI